MAEPVAAAGKIAWSQLAWIAALICGVAPLWASHALPLVDLPQHLHLISVLHRLDDASTLYPDFFARRPVLTPYLGYYYLVSLLNWLLPLDLANRVFLSAYVAGLPLSLAFLLKSLKRPAWPALLAVPFAYGDSFAWGFLNYVAALPLAFLTCGFLVRAVEDRPRRRAWALALAAGLVAVLLFHVQVFAWLGVALPALLLTTPAPEGRRWRARLPALLGVVPGVLLFVLWVGLRVGQPQEIAPGQPWKSWGPMLSEQNLGWKSFEQNKAEFVAVLANQLPDGGDQLAVKLAFLAAALGVALALATGRDVKEGPVARWRVVALAALAVALYFAMPFDIRGYMYYLNTRYAHLAAALLVVCVPPLKQEWAERLAWLGAAVALVTAVPLYRAYRAFDAEEQALERLASAAADKPKVMGLIFATGSAAVKHPVYLHASTVVARERGGLTNFSFAVTPHSPLRYRGEPPPTFPSEWHPEQLNWQTQGQYYDTFVVRGAHPARLFGPLLDTQLYLAAQEGDFYLVRRR